MAHHNAVEYEEFKVLVENLHYLLISDSMDAAPSEWRAELNQQVKAHPHLASDFDLYPMILKLLDYVTA